jgi:Asp-tRNA(Asn)/Glu-tRNA(Gln) amidotransferase A subunit family amidase
MPAGSAKEAVLAGPSTGRGSPGARLGLPAIAVPNGLGRHGLPIGVQLAGHRFADAGVLEAAAAYEIARGPMPWPRSPCVSRS